MGNTKQTAREELLVTNKRQSRQRVRYQRNKWSPKISLREKLYVTNSSQKKTKQKLHITDRIQKTLREIRT